MDGITDIYRIILGRNPKESDYKDNNNIDSIATLVNKLLKSDEFKRKFLKENKPSNWLYKAKGIFTSGQHVSFLFPTTDRFQLSDFMRNGDYQLKGFQFLFDYMRNHKLVEQGSFFIDIGANVGVHTVYALLQKEIDLVIAIEPFLLNISFLKHNLKINDFANKVKIYQTALGDFNGEIELVKNPINCGDNRLKARKNCGSSEFNEEKFASEIVPICTFDNLVTSNSIDVNQIGIIWMDVQGAEGLILNASQKIKQIKCPIYIEFWPYGMKRLDSYDALRNFILGNIKKIVRFAKGEVYEYKPDEIDMLYANVNNSGYSYYDLLLIR